ncbi:TIM-barrel domain-containing protein [Pseudarthrobacter sp. J1738]|uniref:glycoside hydrolase family 31 protein n=1 Tax=unclassified Pseudarthrobacter TaxID=2647000 RepID=UPI003D27CA93
MDTTGTPLGKITAFTQDKNVVNLTGEHGGARITFLDDSTFRVEADPSGTFTDPANTDEGDPARTANIVVGKEKFSGATPTVTDGATMVFKTAKITLELNKATATFRALRADGSLIFAESSAITFGKDSTTEHLQHQDGEQFIGGGMQNGRSVHTGAIINVARNYDWDDDGYPNAVPYYMSSKGYGVLRNTFAPGSYDFGANPTATHREKRFDAYYFVGDYKQSLNAYTTLTGRPLMPPVYALEYGDADCYNRSNPDYSSSGFGDPDGAKQRTPDAIKTAKKFVENDMPAGWMLVNDGYGCEYQQLPEAVADINKQTGLQVGLWTQRSLSNQAYEVGEAGVRMRKLDVAWVGEGYRQALTGCQSAHDGIEQYSDARGTALMVEGWAGAQRCGMQWTGDHTGNLDAIRWQVSALTGAGNSGSAFTTGDVDGIFGGSAESYVRDLQWKAFAPALYSMSGWAQTDKRPWLYGDEATKINRNYLRLRQQLMPFIYTLAQESSATGVSMMRSMPLEYPEQELSYGAEANNQFMLGDDFLVAPVFTDSTVRNGIFLPAGEQWVDYWSGKVYQGGQVLNGYNAPLDTLPVFVKAGAVVPQGIVARNASLVPENSAITLDVYAKGNNSFTLYEDDKVTRAYKVGKASRQQFDVSAPGDANGAISVTIGQRKGDYAGNSASRPYELKVHAGPAPKMVKVGGTKLSQFSSKAAYDGASTGWFFDPSNAGVIYVKAGSVASGTSATVQLLQAGPLGGKNQEDTAAELRVTTAKQVFQNQDTTFTGSSESRV